MSTPSQPLPWQIDSWRRVYGSMREGRFGHATLIAGPRGLGKRHFAQLLAQAVLCQTPTGEGACGECAGCRLTAQGNHPDWIALSPDAPGKPITVDAVREFSARLMMTSQYRGGRVAIIAPAEAMNLNAANSLLKTLEEPPPESFILLVTDRLLSLPATIRSRCQIVNPGRPTREAVKQWLQSQGLATGGHVPEEFELAPLRAQQLITDEYPERKCQWGRALTQLLHQQSDVVTLAQTWQKDEDVSLIVAWLYTWVLDLWRLIATGGDARLFNEVARDELRRQASAYDAVELATLTDRVREALTLLDTQVNRQSLLETLLISWTSLEKR